MTGLRNVKEKIDHWHLYMSGWAPDPTPFFLIFGLVPVPNMQEPVPDSEPSGSTILLPRIYLTRGTRICVSMVPVLVRLFAHLYYLSALRLVFLVTNVGVPQFKPHTPHAFNIGSMQSIFTNRMYIYTMARSCSSITCTP